MVKIEDITGCQAFTYRATLDRHHYFDLPINRGPEVLALSPAEPESSLLDKKEDPKEVKNNSQLHGG